MPTALTLDANVNLNLKQAQAQWQRFESTVNKGSGGGGGVGKSFANLNDQAKSFDKTLSNVTNRVVAFGVAFGTFSLIQKAFSSLISSTIEVEQGLKRINVNLGESGEGLKKFSAGIFAIARQTGSSFEDAAKGAEELARQGLGAEETLKRLKDALTLSRIAGLGQAEAVETLTAALNSFNKTALTSSEVLNKFVAVDTNFAVSSKDLAQGVQRVGSTAQAAGVGIDQLIGLITSLQQTTARGGTTIGNGLKTIFTRLQSAPETITALEGVGVAIKDTSGNLRSAIDILRDYASARLKVGEVERQALDRTISGTQQINILKAALSDLSRQNSVYADAVKTSANATDQAIKKNEELNKTLASLLNSTEVSFQQLFSSIGSQKIGPIFKELLSGVESVRKYFSGETGSKLGSALGDGIINGLSNVLTGPTFVAAGLIMTKVLKTLFQTVQGDLAAALNINSAVTARAAAQERINVLMGVANGEEQKQLQLARSTLEVKIALLAIQQRLALEANIGTPLQNAFIGKSFGRYNPIGLRPTNKIGAIPGFADPLGEAIGREKAAGLSSGQIYVDRDPRIANFANPMGLLVANTRDEPMGGYQGVNRVLAAGGDPKRSGMPNFARALTQQEIINKRFGINDPRYDAGTSATGKIPDAYSAALIRSASETERVNAQAKTLAEKLALVNQGFIGLKQSILEASAAISPKVAVNSGGSIGFGGGAPSEGPSTIPNPVLVGNGKDLSRTYMDQRRAKDRAEQYVGETKRLRDQQAAYLRNMRRNAPLKALLGDNLIEDAVTHDTNLPAIQDHMAELQSSNNRVTDARAKILRQADVRQRLLNLKARKAAREQELAYDRAGIFPGQAYEGPIGPPTLATHNENQKILAQLKSEKRRDFYNKAIFGASFALPFAAGFVDPLLKNSGVNTTGGTRGGQLSGALSGFGNGAGIGGLLLPGGIGLGIGAVIGALVGGFSKAEKSLAEFSEEIDKTTSTQGKISDAAARFRSNNNDLKEAIANKESPQNINRLTEQRFRTLQDIPDSSARERLSKGFSSSKEEDDFFDDLSKKLEQTSRGGEVSKLSQQQGADSFETTIGKLFQYPLKTFGSLGTLGIGNSLNVIGSGLVREGNRKTDLTQIESERKELSDAVLKTLTIENVKGLNTKGLQIGGEDDPSKQQIERLSKIFKDLGATVEVTTDNYRENAQSILDATKEFRKIKTFVEQASKAGAIGLTKSAFTRPANLDVIRRGVSVGGSYGASRGDRSEANLAFYNELRELDPSTHLETKDAYEKAFKGSQTKRATDLTDTFLQSKGFNSFMDRNGNPSFEGMGRALQAVSVSGGLDSGKAKILQGVIDRAKITAKEAGTTVGFTEGVSGITPGADYGAFTKTLKRGDSKYVTTSNIRERLARSRVPGADDTYEQSDINRRFMSLKEVGSAADTSRKFDLVGANSPSNYNYGALANTKLPEKPSPQSPPPLDINVKFDGVVDLVSKGMPADLAVQMKTAVNVAIQQVASQYFDKIQPQIDALGAKINTAVGTPTPPRPPVKVDAAALTSAFGYVEQNNAGPIE